MITNCRCHGISGSCGLRTCWKSLPKFEEIGELLKSKYIKSIQLSKKQKRRVKQRAQKYRRSNKLKRKTRALYVFELDKEELVHINKSPDYCIKDANKGIKGTSGRICNATSGGPEACDILCCGRGYNVHTRVRKDRCKCQFVWCCEVKCEQCEKVEIIHTCK